jgi:hypothetical protein
MMRRLLLLLLLVPIAGCGDMGGGNKIEPSSSSGSPILNKDAAPKAPETGQ